MKYVEGANSEQCFILTSNCNKPQPRQLDKSVNLEDDSRSGRPNADLDDGLKELVEAEPSQAGRGW